MKKIRSFETSGGNNPNTQPRTPEQLDPLMHRCENLKIDTTNAVHNFTSVCRRVRTAVAAPSCRLVQTSARSSATAKVSFGEISYLRFVISCVGMSLAVFGAIGGK
jgi:hypothetical protein